MGVASVGFSKGLYNIVFFRILRGKQQMQKKKLLRKGLAVGIILLFIGIAVAPSININVVKASNDNELIEVTTQACGIKGFGNTTVKLTKQHYQNLEQYLVDFRARLNQTTTREEAVPIFNEAVVELNKYGLLPKGMSVEQAQKFVTGKYQNPKITANLEKIIDMYPKIEYLGLNAICLITGSSDGTDITALFPVVLLIPYLLLFTIPIRVLYALFDLSLLLNLEKLAFLFGILLEPILLLGAYLYYRAWTSPIGIGCYMTFGWFSGGDHPQPRYAKGYLISIGMLGFATAGEQFIGDAFGFSGLRIYNTDTHRTSYLGTALLVKISTDVFP